MKCIYCGKKKTEVKNSREIKRGFQTWRRRYCLNCGRTFTTKESTVADNLFVIKRNGSRQRFVYEKLFASIFVVLNARKNRDSGNDAKFAKKVTGKVVDRLFGVSENKEVSTKKIIELVYLELKKNKPTLADTYASYSDYRIKTMLALGLMSVPVVYR